MYQKIQHGCITKFTLRFTQLSHTLYPIMDTAIFHFKVNLRTTLSFETVHRSFSMSAKPVKKGLGNRSDGLQNAYSDEFGSNFVSKLRSFRHEFNKEIPASESILDSL